MTRLDAAVRVALVRLLASLSAATLLVAPAIAAEPDSAGSLTVEWAMSHDGQGHPTLRGYINNLYDVPVDNVTIRVDGFDAAGQTLSSEMTLVEGPVPGDGRTYFEVPATEGATNYRVTVDSFEAGAGTSASPSEGAERR
jgi:hypothetical protein